MSNSTNIQKFEKISRNFKTLYKIVNKRNYDSPLYYKNGWVYKDTEKPCRLKDFEIRYKFDLHNAKLFKRIKDWRRVMSETILINHQERIAEEMKGFVNLTNELILSNSK